MSFPRQPFLGPALMAAVGIIVADFVAIPECTWLTLAAGFVLVALVVLW